jgi:phosphatidyl-myo-inositol dimannoside synthase
LTDGRPQDARQRDDPSLDVWVLLQAGLLPLSSRLGGPSIGYIDVSDFLNPWVPCGHRWVEAIKRPYAARLRHPHRKRRIVRNLQSLRHVCANSSMTGDLFLRQFGLPARSISVLPPGVPSDCFREPGPEASSEALELLTVARLSSYTRRKDVDGVLRALALLPRELAWRYRVIGDGDDLPRLRVLAESLGLAACVAFLGAVNRNQLLSAYRRADFFILASKARKEDVEGFGIVYLEANAAGVPVLGSREGGAVDAIAPDVSGLVLDNSDPATIAHGIRSFQAERSRFRRESVIEHAARHRWPVIAERFERELRERLSAQVDAGPRGER